MRNDLISLRIPRDHAWPSFVGIDFLIDVYDWDHIVIKPSSLAVLAFSIPLCSGYFPCQMSLIGVRENGASQTWSAVPNSSDDSDSKLNISEFNSSMEVSYLQRVGIGSISCLEGSGCVGVSLRSVYLLCTDRTTDINVPSTAPLELGGKVDGWILNTLFRGCSSTADGGSVQSYGGASLSIESSLFADSFSLGVGGAISNFGAILRITRSLFVNCSSASGGGAITAGEFVCYRSRRAEMSIVEIDSSWFKNCSTAGRGGALRADSSSTSVQVLNTLFLACRSEGPGGAVSAAASAMVTVVDSSLDENSAGWPGGGALHSNTAKLILHGVSCSDNSAIFGGGGAIFWEGNSVPKVIPWCEPGFYPDPEYSCTPHNCASRCLPCRPGTYQSAHGAANSSACIFCETGTFTSSPSSTGCFGCSAGTFSTTIGATSLAVCYNCTAGKYSSTEAASICDDCAQGSFSFSSATACELCNSGQYASGSGFSACDMCVPGSYSWHGFFRCPACDGGTFSMGGMPGCDECEAGTFSSAGSSFCSQCVPGTYSSSGSSECVLCEPGTQCSRSGANSSSECLSCPDGTVALGGSPVCFNASDLRRGDVLDFDPNSTLAAVALPFSFPINCKQYLWIDASPDGRVRFQTTQSTETVSSGETCSVSCLLMSPWYSLTQSSSSLLLERRSEDQIILQWTNAIVSSWISTATMITFQVALFRNGTIVICYPQQTSPGSSAFGASIEVSCNDLYLSMYLPDRPQNDPYGLCYAISPQPEQCSNYSISTMLNPPRSALAPNCRSGHYLDADASCSKCPAGKYQTGLGATASGDCVLCGAGKYSTAVGSNSGELCVDCNRSDNRISDGTSNCEQGSDGLNGSAPIPNASITMNTTQPTSVPPSLNRKGDMDSKVWAQMGQGPRQGAMPTPPEAAATYRQYVCLVQYAPLYCTFMFRDCIVFLCFVKRICVYYRFSQNKKRENDEH